MNKIYLGIDYHKKYSVIAAVNQDGELLLNQRINHTHPEHFVDLVESFNDAEVHIVFESSMNWSWLYEILEVKTNAASITLANPHLVRLIADSQIKTDKIDAQKLAQLLRMGMVPASHVPDRKTRDRKEVLRQRSFWVRQRTQVKNRIHGLIGRQHDLNMPKVTDLFGRQGISALNKTNLPQPDEQMLQQNLSMLKTLNELIKQSEKQIEQDGADDRQVEILQSVPGIGLILSNVLATEIDGIERFRTSGKFLSYAGLIPTTHSSGGKTHHGRLVQGCNKWLRWAFVEAAWVAVGCSPYFGSLYRVHRQRGKKANTAILIVARRMAKITWHILKEDRLYERKQFTPRPLSSLADEVA